MLAGSTVMDFVQYLKCTVDVFGGHHFDGIISLNSPENDTAVTSFNISHGSSVQCHNSSWNATGLDFLTGQPIEQFSSPFVLKDIWFG